MLATIITAAVSALIVIGGWVVGHRINTLQKRRDLRVQYLLDAYRRLEDASGRDALPQAKRAFESAAADIQLLGKRSQIEALLTYLREYIAKGGADIDPVLKLLRDDLRRELHLEQDVPQIHQFRFKFDQPAPLQDNSKPGNLSP